MKTGEKERKVRCDKKLEIAPTIDQKICDQVSRLSYICSRPEKFIGEFLVLEALKTQQVIEGISEYFRFSYEFNEYITFHGNQERAKYKSKYEVKKDRLSMRFYQHQYDGIARLAYSMDTRPTTAAGLLVKKALGNMDIINKLLDQCVTEDLDYKRLKQLKQVIKHINLSCLDDERITLGHLLSYLVYEVVDRTITAKEGIIEWLQQEFRDDE